MTKQNQAATTGEKISIISKTETMSDAIRKRISALKYRPAPTKNKHNQFDYDPNEPLHLPTNKRSGSDE
jgi:hypothetical protein